MKSVNNNLHLQQSNILIILNYSGLENVDEEEKHHEYKDNYSSEISPSSDSWGLLDNSLDVAWVTGI